MDGADFVEDAHRLGEDRLERLVLDLDGFEGPIDLLLTLARDQKVDLSRLSILALADQYLAFVERVRRRNLELAADYLVMAAWLAYLKSRLLLPEPEVSEEEPSGAEMAAALAFQLQRLEAMRKAGKELTERPQLGRDVFARGAPEGVEVVARPVFQASLYELLKAYADFQRRTAVKTLEIEAADLYSVDDALKRFEVMLGRMPDWATLSRFLPADLKPGLEYRSAVCAHFVAMLELAKQGRVELRQDNGTFGPIYLKSRA
ncbi:ScpA family protein [Telmatospirillum sp. J64-1]|uniref:segregation and condensation protein A n=1 Tax=Telmatospirillum sp. J64-1 TaxID=2502183 RepID=UPI00115E8457|nr:ScpA family protein [Telmatospirillum sp. J64-1]